MSNKYISRTLVEEFFQILNKNEIEYVLIKNIDNELPSALKDGKDIDILVNYASEDHFMKIMANNGFLKRIPPLGRENGYTFGYKLPEYQFWQKGNTKETFYIDASFKLMCKSLTPYYWVPLDNIINDRIWVEKVWEEELHCWRMDDKSLIVYLLARCVFDKRTFSEAYIKEIEVRKELLTDDTVKEMLKTVFYKYTDSITKYVLDKKYEDIIPNYFKFTDY